MKLIIAYQFTYINSKGDDFNKSIVSERIEHEGKIDDILIKRLCVEKKCALEKAIAEIGAPKFLTSKVHSVEVISITKLEN